MDWFAIYTRPQCEMQAADRLRASGAEVYVPISKRWAKPRRAKARRLVAKPAFTRYLFIRGAFRWADVRGVDGVEGVVANNLVPVRIPDRVVCDIRAAEDMGLFDIGRHPHAVVLAIGDQVTLVAGPLEGYRAVVKRPPKAKGDVRVEILGKQWTVPLDMIRPVA